VNWNSRPGEERVVMQGLRAGLRLSKIVLRRFFYRNETSSQAFGQKKKTKNEDRRGSGGHHREQKNKRLGRKREEQTAGLNGKVDQSGLWCFAGWDA